MLITLYGINNIGKSTQALRLLERLKDEGLDAVYVKYPVYEIEPSGVFLNEYLRSGTTTPMREEALQLWFTLNRFQFEATLKTWLEEGKIVIAEDYTGTGLVWGMTKGASLEWLENLNAPLIKEDLSILIDGERTLGAVESGHVHETDQELMRRSRQVHLELAKKYDWNLVPLQTEKEATAELIWALVKTKISR